MSTTSDPVTVSFTLDGPMLDAWRRVAPTLARAGPDGKPAAPLTDADASGVARQLLRDFLKQHDPW